MGLNKLVETAKKNNMSRDQLERLLLGGYVPQPKQIQFHAACRRCDLPDGPIEVAFGGARGPGKSHALLAQMALDDCQRVPGLKCLLLRKVGKAVREAFEDLRWKVLSTTPHEYNKSTGTVTFDNGSRIIMGHFQSDKDIDAYLGLEYDVIGVEEATTLSKEKYSAIRTCNRTSKNNFRPRIYTNTNPGGVGHQWFKSRFIDEKSDEVVFIAATVDDNVYINDGYKKTLQRLTGWKKRAWLYGDWDISSGLFFTHVPTVKNIGIPSTWPYVWLSMDYGWTHPTAVVLLAQDNAGITYVIDEYTQARKLVDIHASNIQRLLDRYNVDELYEVVGGGDMWQSESDGTTVAEEYQKYFPKLSRANMSRVAGASNLLKLFGSPEDGIDPKLNICENCTELISQLRSMQHNPRHPEDVLKVNANSEGQGGDDLYDALRYGAMVNQENTQKVKISTFVY